MQVTHVNELLSSYLDDELASRERDRVRAHLEECPECRRHLESLRAAVGLVHSLDPVKVPDGFRTQVYSRLGATAQDAGGRRWIPRWSWQVAAVAAAVLIIGVFSVNLFREIRPIEQAVAPERGGISLGAPGATDLRSAPPA
ncbi:MAG: anti-sigma factor family protein, partial [bacterium]